MKEVLTLGGNAWTKATQSMATPTVPEQIMTTANTVHFIVAAGLAEQKSYFKSRYRNFCQKKKVKRSYETTTAQMSLTRSSVPWLLLV